MLARHSPLLGWLVVAAAVAGAWLLWSPQAGAQTGPSVEVVQQGQEIFASQCATCHGFQGQGGDIPETDELAPPLVGEGAEGVTLAYADLVMRTGRMPPPENDPFDNRHREVKLSDEQRAAVNSFLVEELGMRGEIPAVGEGSAAQGQRVFATNCAQCHGSTGAGGVAGAGAWTPQVNNLDATAIAEAVRVGPFEMPAFSEEQISDEEIGDVVAFLEAVETEPGTPLGLIELNPVFASGFAALFVLLVLLMMRIVAGKPAALADPAGQHEDTATPDKDPA